MQTQINPYLVFNGNCREAMTFYKECLGGELTLQTVADSPMADQWPDNVQQNILHATLMKNHIMLLASDMGGPDGYVKGNTIFLSLTCRTAGETEIFSRNLSIGGKITRPMHEFFGGLIGALTDKYGINWLIYHDKNVK